MRQSQDIFLECIETLGVSQGVLAMWFYHKNTKVTRNYISRKVRGHVKVTESDLTLIQVMVELQKLGFDIADPIFRPNGEWKPTFE